MQLSLKGLFIVFYLTTDCRHWVTNSLALYLHFIKLYMANGVHFRNPVRLHMQYCARWASRSCTYGIGATAFRNSQ